MDPRPYQIEDTAKIRAAFREHRRVLYTLPTGGGKTSMFCDMAIKHVRKFPHALVYILVHRIELMEQVEKELHEQGHGCGLLSPISSPKSDDAIVVASVQTLARRLGKIRPPTLVVTDEAHHAIATSQWGKVGAFYHGCPHLGVTATPCRLSGEGLVSSYDALVCGPSTRQLINLGYLAQPRVYCPAVPDLRNTHSRAGEYISAELEKILDHSTITGDAIRAYQKHAAGKRFICFGVSRKHIERIAQDFQSQGIRCLSVDGSLSASDRKQAVDQFRTGTLTGLVSCQLIDEGFNVPGIECGIDLAPTKSLGRYLQRVGRCLRVSDGKSEALILDLAGNALRHGLPDGEQNWSLAGTRDSTRRSIVGHPPSIRICDQCFAANPSLTDECGLCGYTFPINGRTFISQKGELELLREAKAKEIAAQKAKRDEERAIQKTTVGYKSLVLLAQRRGYRNPEVWASIIHNARLSRKKQMRVRI